MRIAHVSATFPPYYGGTGNVCFYNAQALAENGHDVHVYAPAGEGLANDPEGVTVHRLQPVVKLGNAPLIPQLLLLTTFDIIHLHYPFISGAELTWLSTLRARTPLILTYHNDLGASGLRGAFFSVYQHTLARISLRCARRVCAVSLEHALNSPVIQRSVPDVENRVIEVENGVDNEAFHPGLDPSAVRARHGIPDDAIVCAFVGGLDTAHRFKRVDLLLNALSRVETPHLHALIVGGGDLLPTYKEMANSLGLGQRTHFVDGIPHEMVPEYVAASDFLALPSDSVESFGLVLIEAMAVGKAVIASDLPGVSSVVSHEHDGLLVPPGNLEALTAAVQRLAQMPKGERQSFGVNGRRKVERRFSWKQIGRRLEDVYQDVLSERVVRVAG